MGSIPRWPELVLFGAFALAALVYLLRAPLWTSTSAGARLGEGDDMLAIGAASLHCEAATAPTQCEMMLGNELLRIEFSSVPTLTCVAWHGERSVECVASYVYAPRLKAIAILPQLRGASPPPWSPSGVLIRIDSVLAFRMDLFVWFLSLTITLAVGYRVARRSSGARLRRYSRAAALSALTWAFAMGALLISLFALGYED